MAGKNEACTHVSSMSAGLNIMPPIRVYATYLEPSDKKAICRHFCEPSRPVLEKGEDSPTDIQKRYDVVHRDESEQEHEWDLTDDCSHNVHGLQLHELISFEPKILLQSGYVSIVLDLNSLVNGTFAADLARALTY